jgi:hypothetical protein
MTIETKSTVEAIVETTVARSDLERAVAEVIDELECAGGPAAQAACARLVANDRDSPTGESPLCCVARVGGPAPRACCCGGAVKG